MASLSIILPTFNRLQYLRAAIRLVLEQSFGDWELLIADDGSGGETRSYLSTLHDPPRVRVIELPHRGKPAVARNAAVREAQGEYIAFMDSDDVWLPQKLELQWASLRRRPSCQWSQTQFVLIDAGGTPIREMPVADGWILERLLATTTVIALPSVIVSRALLERAGGFDEQLVSCEDYDLWLRLAALSEIDAIQQPLTLVRRHRQHYAKPIGSCQDSLRVVDKALRAGVPAASAARVRRERAKLQVRLAAQYARGGSVPGALRVLRASLPASWHFPQWWLGALAAAARLLARPERLRNWARRSRRRFRHEL